MPLFNAKKNQKKKKKWLKEVEGEGGTVRCAVRWILVERLHVHARIAGTGPYTHKGQARRGPQYSDWPPSIFRSSLKKCTGIATSMISLPYLRQISTQMELLSGILIFLIIID